MYTTSTAERDDAIFNKGFTYEGTAGYVFELLSGKWFREVFRLWSADIL
jgi:hypothetical protein